MQKTEKLGLNLFERTDPVLAENFNENTNLLEAAIRKKGTMCYGTWAGDGTGNKTLTFDRKPVLVIVCSKDGVFFCFQGRSLCLYHNFTSYAQIGRPITWSEDGCTLTLQEVGHFNSTADKTYQYIAFLED